MAHILLVEDDHQVSDLLREILIQPEFQKEMGCTELHYLLGKYSAEWERKNKLKDVSVLAAAYRAGVPCFTSSPGDSTFLTPRVFV